MNVEMDKELLNALEKSTNAMNRAIAYLDAQRPPAYKKDVSHGHAVVLEHLYKATASAELIRHLVVEHKRVEREKEKK